METKFLLENESILTQSNDSSVVLTNRRLLKNIRSTGHSYFISMQLQNISTIEIHSKSFPLLFILGIVCATAGPLVRLQIREDGLLILGLALGLSLILLYFFTRYHIISVASNGGSKMHLFGRGMKREVLLDFVKKVDQAKSLIK